MTLPDTIISRFVILLSSLATGGSFSPGLESGITLIRSVASSVAGLLALSSVIEYANKRSPVKPVVGT